MKKIIFALFLIGLFHFKCFAQSIGDIQFIGMYADSPDGFAIAVVNDLPGSTSIFFTDDEWTGSAMNTTEGTLEWVTPAAGVTMGTVVKFENFNPGIATVSVTSGSPGTVSESGSVSLSGANEAIIAYVGTLSNPTTFLAIISNETYSTNPGGLTLSGTGLTTDNAAIEFELDEDSMTFNYSGSPCSMAGMSAACVAAILDESNWTTDLGAANNTDISDIPNTDFTAFAMALPVELSFFETELNKDAAELKWQTATETNNAGFEVQRSTDGKNFQNLTFIEGKGTTTKPEDYTYDDKDLRKGQTYYYRLKQIDFDGHSQYSEVLTARLEGSGIAGTFAPNPSRDGLLHLDYTTSQTGDVTLSVFDVAGKQLLSQNQAVGEGNNRIDLNFSALGKGMFFVKMEQGSQTAYEKIIIE